MAMMTSSSTVSNSNDVLYLFTSTEPPYHKDALDILAYPSGVSFRFRYDLKYLPDDLQTEDQFNQKSKNAILVHVRTTPLAQKGPPAEILEHFPIREARIIDLKLVGNFVWIEFLLGDWIKYDKTNHYHDAIVTVMPNCQKTELKHTIISAPKFSYESVHEDLSIPYENSLVIKSWSDLTTLLMQTDEHNTSIFLKFASIQKIKNKFNIERLKPDNIANKLYGFEFSKNTSYRIEVLQRAKTNPDPNFDLEIFSNEKEIRSIQKTAKIQGKYDVLDFIVTSENLERSRRSFFIIRPEKNTASNFTIPRLRFDVDILVSQNLKYFLMAVLGSGVFLSGIAASFQNPDSLPFTAIPAAIGGVLSAIALAFLRK